MKDARTMAYDVSEALDALVMRLEGLQALYDLFFMEYISEVKVDSTDAETVRFNQRMSAISEIIREQIETISNRAGTVSTMADDLQRCIGHT